MMILNDDIEWKKERNGNIEYQFWWKWWYRMMIREKWKYWMFILAKKERNGNNEWRYWMIKRDKWKYWGGECDWNEKSEIIIRYQ